MSRGGYRGIGQRHFTAEACWSLSVWGEFQELQHIGYYAANNLEACEWEFAVETATITTTRGGRTTTQHIGLTYTPCNYGKSRAWFVCPRCARRVAKLFLPAHVVNTDGTPFTLWLCRHCLRITYEQRNARDLYWCFHWRAERIAEKWLGEMSRGWISRQKGQHARTFHRRADQYKQLIEVADSYAFKFLAKTK